MSIPEEGVVTNTYLSRLAYTDPLMLWSYQAVPFFLGPLLFLAVMLTSMAVSWNSGGVSTVVLLHPVVTQAGLQSAVPIHSKLCTIQPSGSNYSLTSTNLSLGAKLLKKPQSARGGWRGKERARRRERARRIASGWLDRLQAGRDSSNRRKRNRHVKGKVTHPPQRIANIQHHSSESWVVLVSVSADVDDMFRNWLYWYQMLHLGLKIIVFAEDNDTMNKYSGVKGIDVLLNASEIGNGAGLDYRTLAYKQMVSRRPFYLLQLFELYTNIIYTDIDTVWLKDPRPYFHGDYDFWAQTDDPDTLCTGFLALKKSNNTRRMLMLWNKELIGKDQLIQPIFNRVLHNTSEDFKYAKLPEVEFPPCNILRKNLSENEQNLVVIVQNDWIIGKQDKIERFKKSHLWRPLPSKHSDVNAAQNESESSDRGIFPNQIVSNRSLTPRSLQDLRNTVTTHSNAVTTHSNAALQLPFRTEQPGGSNSSLNHQSKELKTNQIPPWIEQWREYRFGDIFWVSPHNEQQNIILHIYTTLIMFQTIYVNITIATGHLKIKYGNGCVTFRISDSRKPQTPSSAKIGLILWVARC